MRKITKIIVHCTATHAGREVSVAEITLWHKARGFRTIGYHYVVRLDGRILVGRDESEAGAHCYGQNSCSIGVVYVGGLSAADGSPADTRTQAQKAALKRLIAALKSRIPGAPVQTHREFEQKTCQCVYTEAENV